MYDGKLKTHSGKTKGSCNLQCGCYTEMNHALIYTCSKTDSQKISKKNVELIQENK